MIDTGKLRDCAEQIKQDWASASERDKYSMLMKLSAVSFDTYKDEDNAPAMLMGVLREHLTDEIVQEMMDLVKDARAIK